MPNLVSTAQKTFQKLDNDLLSPILFDNQSGLEGNLRAKSSINKAQKDFRQNIDNDPGKEFQEKEFVKLGKPFDNELVSTIREKFDEHITEDEHTFNIEYEGDIYSHQLRSFDSGDTPRFNFSKHIPEIEQLINDKVQKAVQQYYGSYFQPEYIQIYRNFHIPPEIVEEADIFSNNWHLDGRPPDFIKLFVNLSDVGTEDGPFHIITRDETKKIYGPGYDRSKDGIPDGKVKKEAKPVRAIGESGTAMLANTNKSLHRAGIPSEGHNRDLLAIQLVPARKSLPQNWIKNNEIDIERNGRPHM